MFKFKGKSHTLNYLKNKHFNINNFVSIKKKKLLENNFWIELILKKFKNKKLILRSSAIDEDQASGSNAGKYDSVILKKINYRNLQTATRKIIKKFKSDNDEIIFQEYLNKPEISGVVFTRDINNLAPYFVINYDISGKTNLITGGKKNLSQKTLILHREYNKIQGIFKRLIKICKSLEKIFNTDCLDIEFGIRKQKIFIFQVRPISKKKNNSDKIINSILKNIEKKIQKLQSRSLLVKGKTTIFSNMSDWNPAEMIGSIANILSISLYEELITDSIWAKQRERYGYKFVRSNPLMVNFAFSPYIDLRVDLNSFLPEGLSDSLQTKVLNYMIKKLIKNPELHDKIEFSLIPTCNSLFIKKNLKNFLNEKEIKIYSNLLIKLTNNILSNKNKNPFNDDINKIEKLKILLNSKYLNKSHPIQNIFYIIDICKNLGTLPFAGIARTAFITTSLMKEFTETNMLSENRLSDFYKNIKSINYDFNYDLQKLLNSKISKKLFLKRYGHLRPNTYSINSLNYKEGFNQYFGTATKNKLSKKINFKLTKIEKEKINKILNKIKLDIDAIEFFKIAEKSIYYREYSKYIFSKAIDMIFINLIRLGKEIGVNRDDLQYVSIKTIVNSYSNLSPLKLAEIIKTEINQNKKSFKNLKAIKLPDVITSHKDIYNFTQGNSKENYITSNKISSALFYLDNSSNTKSFDKLKNKIVLIENADPGFDFLFSHNINGLITQYGGVNSHMAIRCMENNIPAAIGVGEKKFNFFKSCKKIELDCQSKKITKLY